MHAGASASPARTPGKAQAPPPSHGPFRPAGANRVNCSDTGVDCLAAKGKAQGHAGSGEASGQRHRPRGPARPPSSTRSSAAKPHRTNFNAEAVASTRGCSARAPPTAPGQALGSPTSIAGAGAVVSLAEQRQVDRHSEQRSEARTSCNEADECSMSNKDTRKEWANASIKAGTWKGPAKEPLSNAARRIAADRAAEGSALLPRREGRPARRSRWRPRRRRRRPCAGCRAALILPRLGA